MSFMMGCWHLVSDYRSSGATRSAKPAEERQAPPDNLLTVAKLAAAYDVSGWEQLRLMIKNSGLSDGAEFIKKFPPAGFKVYKLDGAWRIEPTGETT